MKKLVLVLLVGFFVSMLYGCEYLDNGTIDTNQPPLIVVDDTITIQVGDDRFVLSDEVIISDDIDDRIELKESMVDYGDFDLNTIGSYDVVITVSDSLGETSTITTTLNVVDMEQPIVTLNGDAEITLTTLDTYQEFSATVIDNYDTDLTVTIDGSVDTTIPGTYQIEYYCVDNSGNQSDSVFRTVIVNQAILDTPVLLVNEVTTTESSISFTLDMQDPDDIAEITFIELYQGSTLIDSATDVSIREFTGLLSDNDYTIKVGYSYNNGVQDYTDEVSYNTYTKAYDVPTIQLTNIVISNTVITFDIEEVDTFDLGQITSVDLFEGDAFKETLTNLTSLTFIELSPNNVYTIDLTYEYDLLDGNGPQEINLIERRELSDTSIIENGNISSLPNGILVTDSDGWGGYSEATTSIIDEELHINITDTGIYNYALQYAFHDVVLEAESTYVLRFDASSSIDRTIQLDVGTRISASIWEGLDTKTVELTSDLNSYEFRFTTTSALTSDVELIFEIGAALQSDGTYLELGQHTIVLDNLSVRKVHNPTDDIRQVHNWLHSLRHDSGLHAPREDNAMVSLFDNALIVIAYSMLQDFENAEAILDYFDGEISTELQDEWGGFAQFRDVEGNILFPPIGIRWMGDNAWMLIAINYYHEQTGTTKYATLQTALTDWLISLQIPQGEDQEGCLWGGYDSDGNRTYPVTEGMIDAYNAVLGYSTFHEHLLGCFENTRMDTTYGILRAWPDHPTYQYSLDTIGWAYLGMNNWPYHVLETTDLLFMVQENGIYGYSPDIDKDTIHVELTMTMAATYNKAGNYAKANELIRYMETLFVWTDDDTKGLIYATQQTTGYADFPLWDGVDTKPHVSGSAWYIYAKMRVNPMRAGLPNKEPQIVIDSFFYR